MKHLVSTAAIVIVVLILFVANLSCKSSGKYCNDKMPVHSWVGRCEVLIEDLSICLAEYKPYSDIEWKTLSWNDLKKKRYPPEKLSKGRDIRRKVGRRVSNVLWQLWQLTGYSPHRNFTGKGQDVLKDLDKQIVYYRDFVNKNKNKTTVIP